MHQPKVKFENQARQEEMRIERQTLPTHYPCNLQKYILAFLGVWTFKNHFQIHYRDFLLDELVSENLEGATKKIYSRSKNSLYAQLSNHIIILSSFFW